MGVETPSLNKLWLVRLSKKCLCHFDHREKSFFDYSDFSVASCPTTSVRRALLRNDKDGLKDSL